ncbi:UNVERIFIED_CONTAM: hypothetical protein Sindi_2998600, partial [Sesamum indicum]
MESSEANSLMLRLRHLGENLEELDRKFGQYQLMPKLPDKFKEPDIDTIQVANKEFLISIHLAMERLTRTNSKDVTFGDDSRGSRPVASDSSTDCTRPSPDSSETTTIESHEVHTPVDSSQPSTSGFKEGENSLRPMTDTSKANTNELISSSA